MNNGKEVTNGSISKPVELADDTRLAVIQPRSRLVLQPFRPIQIRRIHRFHLQQACHLLGK